MADATGSRPYGSAIAFRRSASPSPAIAFARSGVRADAAIVGEPTNRHSGFRELDRVVLHAEVDLACGATFPRHEAGVAEPDRHACGRTGRQRHEGRAIDDGAVKGQSARAVRERRQHDRGARGNNDQGHDDQTGDEAEHVEATAGLIERLRRVGHEVMERSDRPGRYE